MDLNTLLIEKKIFLEKSTTIDIKRFTKSRSYEIVYGVDLNKFNTIVFFRKSKSRILQKDIIKLEDILNSVSIEYGLKFGKKILFYNSSICSKSLKLLNLNSWIYYDFM